MINNSREFLAVIAERKMERLVGDSEIQQAITGQIFENLPLSGDLSLRRELHEDGSKGAIVMHYTVTRSLGLGDTYSERAEVTPSGEVRYALGSVCRSEGEPLSGFRRAILAAKIIKGKPDHWDRETDFYGLTEEYED